MGKYLKMADVFAVEIRTDDESGSLNCDEDSIILESLSGANVADYTLHAINSHDELVEMNKELLAALEAVIEWVLSLSLLFDVMHRNRDLHYEHAKSYTFLQEWISSCFCVYQLRLVLR